MDTEHALILLVEDDPDDALLFRDMLQDVPSARFDLAHAPDLETALTMLGRTRPDVVLLDLSLPDSRGLATFERVHQAHPDTPIVVLTGLQDETMAVAAVQRGAQDYLMKSEVSGALLVRSLHYAIERQQASHYRAALLARERLDTAIEHMGDGIIVVDEDWRVVTTNRAACLLLNLGEGECFGDALEDALAAFELSEPIASLRSGTERTASFEIARPDTLPPLYLDARLTRMVGSRAQPINSVLVMRDVTDERREQRLKANFLMMVSHKLRTPLTVLVACLELCRRLPPERIAEQLEGVLDICDVEVARLGEVIDALLDLKALATSELGPSADAADVATVADAALAPHADGTVVSSVHVEPDAGRVACGADHLRLVMGQLIDNAVKFADKDPVRISVSARRTEGGAVEVAIADNGPGIPHEYHDRIFDGFVQVEDLPTGQVPGLGVGLFVAREIAEAHGGSVSVQSELGQGTTFVLTLPAADSAPDPSF